MALPSARPLKKPPPTEFSLLDFETYEDYLDSIYNKLDYCYLQDVWMCRKIAEYGYRRDGVTFNKNQFWKKKKKVERFLTPVELNIRASDGFRFGDPAQNALAIRERANRAGLICTIIFVNYTTRTGREISGYIDYAHSLIKKDWRKFFKQNVTFYPDDNDLGYFDWKKGKALVNDSIFYKTLMSPHHGLLFQHKYDRMLITPDPFLLSPGTQTRRHRIKSQLYNDFVLFDHVLRSRK